MEAEPRSLDGPHWCLRFSLIGVGERREAASEQTTGCLLHESLRYEVFNEQLELGRGQQMAVVEQVMQVVVLRSED
jgi:hypothetical protein